MSAALYLRHRALNEKKANFVIIFAYRLMRVQTIIFELDNQTTNLKSVVRESVYRKNSLEGIHSLNATVVGAAHRFQPLQRLNAILDFSPWISLLALTVYRHY